MRINNYSSIRRLSWLLFICLLTSVNLLSGQAPELEIWQIQGANNASPYSGSIVRTSENVVTAVGDKLFFIQTPTARSDQDPKTSDGLMVYTGYSPSVRPGDLVTISGQIQEFYGQTEFGSTNLTITVINTQQTLPEPIKIDHQFPGLAPKSIPDLEQVEGMLVQISGISTGPTDENGQFPMRGGLDRSFREPGILFPGEDGLPVWDGNPEVFRFDPDGVGAADNRLVTSGTLVTATAVFSQNSWSFLAFPTEYTLEGGVGLRAVREKKEEEITIGSLNSLRLIDGTSGYSDRVKKFARYIQELMHFPDIIGFQEVGSKRVLDDLAVQLKLLDDSRDYDAYLIAADGDIQTGFLVKNMFSSVTVTQLGREERLSTGGNLHDRPPLLLEVQLQNPSGQKLRVMNLHMRSLNGIEGDEADKVRTKRFEQAASVARLVEQWRDESLVIIGDFNAFEFTDGYVDVVNQIQGTPTLGALRPPQAIVNPPLRNLVITHQAPSEQYSFIFEGNAQLLDHCLSNELPGFAARELAFVRGNADQPNIYLNNAQVLNRTSDHDGFVLFLSTDTSVPVTDLSVPSPEVNMPNPIQAGQLIEFTLKEHQPYELNLVDGLGRVISSIRGEATQLREVWPQGVNPGIYFLSLRTRGGVYTWSLIAK